MLFQGSGSEIRRISRSKSAASRPIFKTHTTWKVHADVLHMHVHVHVHVLQLPAGKHHASARARQLPQIGKQNGPKY